jgi:hypothetical protein
VAGSQKTAQRPRRSLDSARTGLRKAPQIPGSKRQRRLPQIQLG